MQLDYAEITSVPPLPLWTLLVADKESPHHPSTIQEAKVFQIFFSSLLGRSSACSDIIQANNNNNSLLDKNSLPTYGTAD